MKNQRDPQSEATMGTLIVFSCDGSIRCVASKKQGEPQLKQLYSLIGTDCVEGMPILKELAEKDMMLYADETGVLKKKPFNPFVRFLIPPRAFGFLEEYGSPAGTLVLEVPKKKDLSLVLSLAKKKTKLAKAIKSM